MANTSKELLDCPGEKPSLIESIFSKKKVSLLEGKRPGVGKLLTTAVPTSQFLGKAKDFLGIMAEANEKLQQDAQENSRSKYDIEVLDGSDEEHIEMDLLLGITDLHTTEAVAAAESTVSGFQASKSFGGGGGSSSSSSDTESESDDDVNNDNDDDIDDDNLLSEEAKLQKSNSGEIPTKNRPKKRPKIVVLD